MQLCEMGASTVDSGVVMVRCKGEPLSDDPEDAPDFGEAMIACALGVTARPYPSDASGAAQAIVDDSVPGQNGVVVAARDTRKKAFLGKHDPGDTTLHSTGPGEGATVTCKEKGQVACVVTDSNGKTAIMLLDGTADKFTVAIAGSLFEIGRDFASLIGPGGKAGIVLDSLGNLTLKYSLLFLNCGKEQPPTGFVAAVPMGSVVPAPIPGAFAKF